MKIFKICTFIFTALFVATNSFGMAPLRQRVSALISAVQAVKPTNFFSVQKSTQTHLFKADVRDAQGRTPLMIAAQNNDVPSMEMLITHGANIHLQDEQGETPLHHATLPQHAAATAYLMHHGAHPHIRNYFGLTPFAYDPHSIVHATTYAHYVQIEQKSYWQRFKDFVKNSYKKYGKKMFGSSTGAGITMHVVKKDNTKEQDLFIEAVQNENWKEAKRLAPNMPQELLNELLFTEVKQKYADLDTVKQILNLGAKVVRMASGNTPLHIAAYYGHTDIVEFLCQIKVAANLPDTANNSTPAHYAAIGGHKEIINVLKKYGADLTLKNNEGKTPLDY